MEKQHKRLIYKSMHRSTKEADFILGHFARAHLPMSDEGERRDFEHLLDQCDLTILDWIHGVQSAPEEFDTPVLQKLKHFVKVFSQEKKY